MINIFFKNLICNQKDNLVKIVVIARVPSSGESRAIKELFESNYDRRGDVTQVGIKCCFYSGLNSYLTDFLFQFHDQDRHLRGTATCFL